MPKTVIIGGTEIIKNKCELCGYSEYSGSLHVHHKDGDKNNNNMSNLSVLCSNCHMEYHHNNKSTSKKRIEKNKRTKNALINENYELEKKIKHLINILTIRDTQIEQQARIISNLQ